MEVRSEMHVKMTQINYRIRRAKSMHVKMAQIDYPIRRAEGVRLAL